MLPGARILAQQFAEKFLGIIGQCRIIGFSVSSWSTMLLETSPAATICTDRRALRTPHAAWTFGQCVVCWLRGLVLHFINRKYGTRHVGDAAIPLHLSARSPAQINNMNKRHQERGDYTRDSTTVSKVLLLRD